MINFNFSSDSIDEKYRYRHDGNFLCHVHCNHCDEGFDVPAMADANSCKLCVACKQVFDWEREEKK